MTATRAAAVAAIALLGCDLAQPEPGRARRDGEPDGLYRDFWDGKYDDAGHPLGALVWEPGNDACASATGAAEAEGWAARPGRDDAGVVCDAEARELGLGRFVVNVRALVPESGAGDVLEVVVTDDAGDELARETVRGDAFDDPMVYANAAVRFTHRTDGPVRVTVRWLGDVPVRIEYVELFRAARGVTIEPASGVLADGATVRLELQDPPESAGVELWCDDVDRTAALHELLASGAATRVDTPFRALIEAPAAELLAGCEPTTRVRARVVSGSWVRAAARVTYYAALPACPDWQPGGTRVLLTGFEPFPADSRADNSSERAVMGFDATAVPDVEVMRLILPVEWRTAAAIATDVIARCQPDLVIGFGQGRWAVDVELTAYNRMDTSEIAGGVPDNRGEILGGEPIDRDGPATQATALPADALVAALRAAGIDTDTSTDPGRYICNNLFYAITRATPRAGFIHLPYLPTVDDADQRMLQTVVETAIELSR